MQALEIIHKHRGTQFDEELAAVHPLGRLTERRV